MYSLVVFDWDGTLSNSIPRIIESMQVAIANMGWPQRAPQEIAEIIGLGLPEAIQTLYPGISGTEIEKLRQYYSQQFISGYTAPSPLYDGVENSLQLLRECGYCLAVATGKSRRGMERIFDTTDWGKYFHAVRCADETRSKPHPQMLAELMEAAGATAEQTLMVGDTEFDLEMAVNAQVDSVAVSYGAHDSKRFHQYRPKLIVDSIPELTQWLRS